MRPLSVIALPVLALSLSRPSREPSASTACGPPRPGANAFAVIERHAPTDTLATITICLTADSTKLRIAGYHGELAMNRTNRIVRVDRPTGGTRIENTTEPGRVSFAGVAATGMAPGAVLVLSISQRRPPDDSLIRLTMLDVTDINGRDVVSQIHVEAAVRAALPH